MNYKTDNLTNSFFWVVHKFEKEKRIERIGKENPNRLKIYTPALTILKKTKLKHQLKRWLNIIYNAFLTQ